MASLYFSELISSLPLWTQTFVDCAAPAIPTRIKSANAVIPKTVMIIRFLLALSHFASFIFSLSIFVQILILKNNYKNTNIQYFNLQSKLFYLKNIFTY